MHFEDLLNEIGSFGRYQRILCFVLIPLTTGACCMTFYSQIFLLTAPQHTCRQHDSTSLLAPSGIDATDRVLQKVEEILNYTDYNEPGRQHYNCHQFDPNLTLSSFNLDSNFKNISSLIQLSAPTKPCTSGWDYDFTRMFSTYTSEHNLVCDDAWKPYLVATLFWVGNTIGSWLFGIISDTYGRRPTVLLSHLMYGTAGIVSVFVSNFYGFLVLRFLVGFCHHTVSHLPFVLVVEYCGLNSRVVPLLTIMMTYTTVSIITPAVAWMVWDWRILALIGSVPALFLIIIYRWLPESSSWLMARGQKQRAKTQLEKVAKANGRTLPQEMFMQLFSNFGDNGSSKRSSEEREVGKIVENDVESSSRGQSVVQVVKYPHLRINILLVLLVWMLACMCYYGHCQNTSHLGSNIFMSYLLGAVVEVPSWSAPWLINRLGRRLPLAAGFLISGIACFVYATIPQHIEWLVLTVALVGRCTITGAYYITLQYGPEVFPTIIRGQGVALSETLGGVAIFLSPSIVYLGEFHRTAPLLVFGGLSVLAGLATLLLPETAGVVLPQTLPQAELFACKATPSFCRQRPKKDAEDCPNVASDE